MTNHKLITFVSLSVFSLLLLALSAVPSPSADAPHTAAAATTVAPAPVVPEESPCPTDMVLVDGMFCPEVSQTCASWITDVTPPLRCVHFSDSRCLSSQRVHMRFCMDRYESPNREGANPRILVTWVQAQHECQAQGRRLCTANEWTFACEGPDVHPYPYGDGMTRDSTACRIDHLEHPYSPARLANPATRLDEARRAYEAVPSGQMAQCVSWAGVHDMTGNVDEWVVNPHGSLTHAPYRSGLKGGWWGPVRTRCRPMTVSHGPTFDYYQIGFRCCSNATESNDSSNGN